LTSLDKLESINFYGTDLGEITSRAFDNINKKYNSLKEIIFEFGLLKMVINILMVALIQLVNI
jgi:hypothetical protein